MYVYHCFVVSGLSSSRSVVAVSSVSCPFQSATATSGAPPTTTTTKPKTSSRTHDLLEMTPRQRRLYEQQQTTARSDEQLVTRAKQMGRELFNDLPPTERRQKMDAMVYV